MFASLRRSKLGLVVAGAAAVASCLLSPPGAAQAEPHADPIVTPGVDPAVAAAPGSTATLKTWSHANAVATTGPIGDAQVRRSPFYDASVTPAKGPKKAYSSFVYMSVPRGGNGKIGYTEDDGAEYTSKAAYTMSWSSFEYAADV